MKGGQSNKPHFIGVKYVRLAESTYSEIKERKSYHEKILLFYAGLCSGPVHERHRFCGR